MSSSLSDNPQFLLFCFERAIEYKDQVESLGIPFLCIPPYTYHSTKLKSWPPISSTVIVTSSRTFKMVNDPNKWSKRKVYVVGQGTAKSAIELGINPIYIGSSGGAEIVHKTRLENPLTTIYHVGGSELSSPLLKALAATDHKRIVAYQRAINPSLTACQSNIKLSVLASTAATEIVKKHPVLSIRPVVCIGKTTAEHALKAKMTVAGVCETPSFDALVELAVSVYSRC